MAASRRTFIQSIGLLALQKSGLRYGSIAAAMPQVVSGKTDSPRAPEVVDALSFGVDANRRLLDLKSYYRVPAALSQHDRLCFDVSNNRISCSINTYGVLERFAIEMGVSPVEIPTTPPGAYVEKDLYRAGPWPMLVAIGGGQPASLETLGQPEIYLEDNLLPRYEWTVGAFRLRMLVFAPHTATAMPRAVCTVWSARAISNADLPSVKIMVGSASLGSSNGAEQTIPTTVLCDQGREWNELATGVQPSIAAEQTVAFAMLIAEDTQELARTQVELGSQSCNSWLNQTKEYHSSRYGKLSIPDSPFYAELYTRAAELSRQSLILDTEGRSGGGFNGSDLPNASNVWMRDCFYSSLPQSFLLPQLCSRSILFLLQWGIPSHPLGDHTDRFPGATGITNSLGNSVAGIVLAGAYYAYNGDAQFFLKNPQVLSRSIEILDQVLVSRREDEFLFPSIYVSDGESRGDFHTGSNIFLWRAFSSLARLAGEVYGQPALASVWEDHAQRLRGAILSNCVATQGGNRRFVEGSMQDHTTISGHDGEESDVTLAAFYEFCEPDDDAYINSAREAISSSNPYAITELEGIWWYAHRKWSSATFPGWITALVSFRSEDELITRLERIRTLTDADGSFWWWPYSHDAALRIERPLRGNSKCGWAAGIYICFFTHQVLGLAVDAAKHKLAFRPYSPWKEFAWKSCRLGSVECDCSYLHRDGRIIVSVRNRMTYPMEITLQAILPEGKQPLQVLMGKVVPNNIRKFTRYGREAIEVIQDAAPGAELKLVVKYDS